MACPAAAWAAAWATWTFDWARGASRADNHPPKLREQRRRIGSESNKKRPGVSTGPFRLPRLCAVQTGIQFGRMRPAPLQRGQSGSESLMLFLGCGRTALPVPPHAWQKSFATIGFGFFKITSPIRPSGEKSARETTAPWGTGNRNHYATPWLVLSREHSDALELPTS